MLVFVDQDWFTRLDEPARIGAHRRSRCRFVTVDDHPAEACGQLAKQSALAHGPRAIEDEHGFFRKTECGYISQTTLG
jgi:hypothetical protein